MQNINLWDALAKKLLQIRQDFSSTVFWIAT